MERLLSTLLVSAIVLSCNTAPTGDFAVDSRRFYLDFYNAAAGRSTGSVVLSPFSVQTALGLLYLAADGSTAEQMSQVLHFERDQVASADNFKSLLDSHATKSPVQVANKIFVDQKFEVKPEFTELAAEKFYSAAENLDTSNGRRAAEVINSWVESKTNNKVQNLVTANDVQNSPSVIVNAVYFKAEWLRPFRPSLTAPGDFWLSEKEAVSVDMMHQTQNFPYGEFDDFKAVKLPFKGINFSFVVVLPNEHGGLKPLEARFLEPTTDLKVLLDSLENQGLNLQLPKFKVETSTDLSTTLTNMGLTDVFSASADFSKLSSEKVRVGKVLHKAVIEVDEKGTEAAAATGIIFTRMGFRLKDPPKEFKVDRPFLYFLVDNDGYVFFMGRYEH